MITVITGEIGAGKTTFAMVNVFDPSVEDDREVYCDLSLNHEELVERYGEELVSARIHHIPRLDPETGKLWFADISRLRQLMEKRDAKGRGPVIIIDEAHDVFPSGIKKVVDPKTGLVVEDCYYQQLQNLLTMSRHYTSHLVFITQRPGALFYPICELAKESFFVENTVSLGFPGCFRVKVFGQLPSRSLEKLSAFDITKCGTIGYPSPVKYDQSIQKLFKSQTKTSSGESGSPQALEAKRISKSIWKNPKVVFFGLLAAGGIIWTILSWGASDPVIPEKSVNGPIVQKSPVANVKDPDGVKVLDTVSDGAASVQVEPEPQGWVADDMAFVLTGNVYNLNPHGALGSMNEWAVMAYDSNGKIWMGERPLNVVVSYYRYVLTHEGCSINLSRGSKTFHRMLVPGCVYSANSESSNVGSSEEEREGSARGPSSVQGAASSDQARSIETADRLSRKDDPSIWNTR